MEISDVLSYIAQADDGHLNEITSALTARYKTLFPDWEVVYLALPLQDSERREQLWELARKNHS